MEDTRTNYTSIYLFATNRCNLGCKYCYEKNRTGDMSQDVMKRSIDWLIEQKDPRIRSREDQEIALTFFGGEPLMNYPVVEYGMRYAYDRYKKTGLKVGLYILTNGTIFTDKMYDFFKEAQSWPGINFHLQISMDGCKSSHDLNRVFAQGGKGSYDTIIKNAKRFAEIFPNLIVRQTVVPERVNNLSKDFSALLSSGAKICNLTPIVEGNWNKKNIEIYTKELEKCIDIYKNHPNNKKMNFNMVHSTILRMEDKQFHSYKGCRAGVRLAAVDIHGDIYPCHRFAAYKDQLDYKLGDVFSGIDFDGKNYSKMMKLHNSNSPCDNCDAIACNRCYATNMLMSRDPQVRPSTGYCEMNWTADKMLRKKIWELLESKKINMNLGSIIMGKDQKTAINVGEGTEVHNDLQDVMARCVVKLAKDIQIVKSKLTNMERHMGLHTKDKKTGKEAKL